MIYGVAMQPASAPRTPANAPRPGRRWYVAAAVLPVVTTALGVVLGVHALRDAVDAVDTGHRFAGGDTVTLRLDPAHGKSIWIRDRGPSARQSCDISGPGESALTDPGIDVFLTRKETWNPLFGIDVSQAGEYRVTCSSRGGPSQYALGEAGGSSRSAGGCSRPCSSRWSACSPASSSPWSPASAAGGIAGGCPPHARAPGRAVPRSRSWPPAAVPAAVNRRAGKRPR